MDRRDFIKKAMLSAVAGAMVSPGAIARGAERQAATDEAGKGILNYNPNMRYRPMGRTGVDVSALGFGMLRLPMLANGHVDMDQSVEMVHRAIEGGVNYIDTGRVYINGESEQAVGKALAGGWRDRVYVTSKSPWWVMERPEDFERLFDESRRAIGTDVIDFYHIHMIMHRGWREKVLPYRLIEKMEKLKAEGKIRFMGFSFHDSLQLFKQVVEYTPAWDFCLIQHNYLDYEYEAGVLGPKYAAANGMGLAVMKPVRTGFLARLPQSMKDALASTGVRKPDTEWALDYLWDIPEVSVAVSGMGSMGRHPGVPFHSGAYRLHGVLPVHSLSAECGHRIHIRLCVQQLSGAPRPEAGDGGLHGLHVSRTARRPCLLLCRLRAMPAQVPASSRHTPFDGQGEGGVGEMTGGTSVKRVQLPVICPRRRGCQHVTFAS